MSTCVLSRKEQHTEARTFWFKGFSLISLVTFNEAYNYSLLLPVAVYLPWHRIQVRLPELTLLFSQLHTPPLPETHVRVGLSQMDGIVLRSAIILIKATWTARIQASCRTSGRSGVLQPLSPIRTVHDSFPSYGSSHLKLIYLNRPSSLVMILLTIIKVVRIFL